MLEKLGYAVSKQGGHGAWVDEQPSFSARICSLLPFTSEASSRTTDLSPRIFSLLQFLGLASLLLSVRGQRTDPFPAQFELSSLNGTNGIVLKGERGQERSGTFVSSAGDFDGDGVVDFLIGDFLANAGNTYVIFGGRNLGTDSTLELSKLNSTNSLLINGEQSGDWSGFSVSSGGDLNSDGITDILIGAPKADPTTDKLGAGKAYVVFGSHDLGSSGTLKLSSLNGTTGFVLKGEQEGDNSGWSVSSAEDVNGDGKADFLIGAQTADPTNITSNAGKTYVIFGGLGLGSRGTIELSSLNGSNGFVIKGENAGDRCGVSVSRAGDVNGDGSADILIGASQLYANAGKTYVIFGGLGLGSNGTLDISRLNGTTGFVINGEKNGDQNGRSLSSAGDVNGDGTDDFLFGANIANTASGMDAGKTYVVFGSHDLGSSGTLKLSSLNGRNGFVLNGESEGDLSGRSVSSTGDVNGDGFADFLIGARGGDPTSGRPNAGKTYVIFGGHSLGSSSATELSSLDGTTGFVLNGEHADDLSGAAVSSAGDVNGDGIADILVGAPGNRGGMPPVKVYVIFGRNVIQPLSPSFQATSSKPTLISQSNTPYTTPLRTLTPSSHSTQAKTPTPAIPSFAKVPSVPSSDSRPLYVGIAVTVAALACSLVAGGLFYMNRKVIKGTNKNERGIARDHQEGSQKQVDSPSEQDMVLHQNYGQISQNTDYDKAPAPTQIYEPLNLEEPGNYQGVYDLKQLKEIAYESPSSPLE